jgi:hypothetical protein
MEAWRGWSSTMWKAAGVGAILAAVGGGYLWVLLRPEAGQKMPTAVPSPQASGNSGSAAVQLPSQAAAVGQGQEQDVVTLVPLDALIEDEGRATSSSSAFVPFETEGSSFPPVNFGEGAAAPPRIPLAQD